MRLLCCFSLPLSPSPHSGPRWKLACDKLLLETRSFGSGIVVLHQRGTAEPRRSSICSITLNRLASGRMIPLMVPSVVSEAWATRA